MTVEKSKKGKEWKTILIEELNPVRVAYELAIGFILVLIVLGAAEAIRAIILGYGLLGRFMTFLDIATGLLLLVLFFKLLRLAGRMVLGRK